MATRKNLVSLLGMFHCTFSNNWPKLATLADNGAQTNEHKAQRTKGAKKHQLPKGGATFPVEGWCGWVQPWVVGGGGGWGCYPLWWVLTSSSPLELQVITALQARWTEMTLLLQWPWWTKRLDAWELYLSIQKPSFASWQGSWLLSALHWVTMRLSWGATVNQASCKWQVDHTNSTTHGVGHTALYPSSLCTWTWFGGKHNA